MKIWITTHEGGFWQTFGKMPIAQINLWMYPYHADGAVLFPCGLIYDNVLARLGFDPWRDGRDAVIFLNDLEERKLMALRECALAV